MSLGQMFSHKKSPASITSERWFTSRGVPHPLRRGIGAEEDALLRRARVAASAATGRPGPRSRRPGVPSPSSGAGRWFQQEHGHGGLIVHEVLGRFQVSTYIASASGRDRRPRRQNLPSSSSVVGDGSAMVRSGEGRASRWGRAGMRGSETRGGRAPTVKKDPRCGGTHGLRASRRA